MPSVNVALLLTDFCDTSGNCRNVLRFWRCSSIVKAVNTRPFMLVEFGYTYLQNPSKIHYLIQKGKKKNKQDWLLLEPLCTNNTLLFQFTNIMYMFKTLTLWNLYPLYYLTVLWPVSPLLPFYIRVSHPVLWSVEVSRVSWCLLQLMAPLQWLTRPRASSYPTFFTPLTL